MRSINDLECLAMREDVNLQAAGVERRHVSVVMSVADVMAFWRQYTQTPSSAPLRRCS